MTPPSNAEQQIAREYLRVSQDQTGRLQSPAEQHADNQRAADSHGWTLGEPYAEAEAVSASRYATRARAAFDRLTRDLTAGRFAARVLILWESSRGSRRVGEWVALIEACEDADVLVHVTTHGRTYDPANARDRRALLEDAVDSEYESAKTSARLRRAFAAAAADGKPGGRIPYGYTRTYDPVTRRLISQDPHPAEAPVIGELYDRLHAGETFRAIARDFADRGILTRGSKGYPPRPFTPQYLRQLALRPCYGGLRVHQPIAGPRYQTCVDGAVEAVWPPLTPPEVWHAVHAMLTNPARRTSRPGRAVHLLSMIARCGECGDLLRVRYRGASGDTRDYVCRGRGCVRIDGDTLDRYAETVMLAYLAEPDVIGRLRAGNADDDTLAKVRTDLAAARNELADWRAAAGAGRVTLASFAAVEPGIVARIAGLEGRERELSAPPELAGLLPGDDVAASWAGAGIAARRRVARMLCQPSALGWLMLNRSARSARLDAAGRVRWDRDREADYYGGQITERTER